MKEVKVFKDGVEVQSARFNSDPVMDAWVQMLHDKAPWGYPERIVQIETEYSQEDVLEVISEDVITGYNLLFDENNEPVLNPDGDQEFDYESPILVNMQTKVRLATQFTYTVTDITDAHNAEQDKANKIANGAKARQTCQTVLDLIAGENLSQNLTSEQITEMVSTFANIQAALQAARPTLAKSLISAVVVDGVLVSQALKDGCLDLLSEY